MSTTENALTKKFSFGRMIGYGSAQFGFEFLYSTIGIFAMFFLTDVALIGAALAGVILLIARFWDAFFDLFMGYISDHTRTRWGKRRPYMLFGAIPMGLLFFLFFLTPPLPPELRFIYYMVLMVLVWTAYSLVNVPWASMLPGLSLDAKERSKIMGVARFLSMVALIIVGAVTRPLAGAFSSAQVGWANMALIYGIIMIVFTYICFFSTREVYSSDEGNKYQFKDVLKLIGANKAFINLCAVIIFVFIVFTASGTMLNYYFKYCLNNESLVSIAFLFTFGLGALLLPLWVLLSNRIGKKTVFMLGLALYGLGFFTLYFPNITDMMQLIPIFVLFAFGFSGVSLGIGTLLPDTVEFGEWKTGERNEGLLYGVNTFILKLATSVGAIAVGIGLQMSNYVPNIEQTEGSLMGIRLLTSIMPAVLSIIGVVILAFYPINEKMHAQMVKDIAERKGIS